jgi:hypothetical protein
MHTHMGDGGHSDGAPGLASTYLQQNLQHLTHLHG